MNTERDGDPESQPWLWEVIDPGRTAVSGDFAKEFKNETVKEPGVLAADHIPAEAGLLVRETIQNSWDAARERFQVGGPEQFAVRFRLFELAGAERERFVVAIGLRDLGMRVREVNTEHGTNSRRDLGLGERDCLSNLGEGRPLRLLEVKEEHGGGMGGPWVGDRSKLYKAMCSLGITPSTTGRGGSYGYGKAGLIRGSKIRTVVAYTCFPEDQNDLGITRRLLGMTYWGSHQLGSSSYMGTRRFGARTSKDSCEPLVDDDADETARRLGIATRHVNTLAELGTTMLVVDPIVDASSLLRATERFWWPALCDSELSFEVSVVDESGDGVVHHPRPLRVEALSAFLETYENALSSADAKRERHREHRLGPIGSIARPGTVALAADPDGWSFPQTGVNDHVADSDGIEHRSLVALVRSPRMVVEYFEAARNTPHIRGTFVAADEADDALRDTEPKAHDAWHTDSSAGDVPPGSAELASSVLRRIRDHVNAFRRDIKPKPKPNRDLRLPFWDELARMLEGSVPGPGPVPPPPPPPPRPFSIQPGHRLEIAGDGGIFVSGTASVEFSEHHAPGAPDGDVIEVRVRYRFEGADRKELVNAELDVEAPADFVKVNGKSGAFKGKLRVGETIEFAYLSDPYDSEWTGSLTVEADLVDPTTARGRQHREAETRE